MTSDNEMNNQAAQTMPFQPEIFRAIARSTSDTAKTNALLNAAREIERLTAALSQTAGVADGVRVCKWHQQDEGYDTFSTGCGHEYTVNECTDGNVQLPYCPFCAKPLIGIAWNEDDDVSLSEALSSSAAAPAASGGEDGPQHFDGHDHEGFPGGCERFGHSPKNCPAAASVSERARASKQVHDMLIDLRAAASIGRPITGDELHELEQGIIRAIEQALTQQRGSASYNAGMAMHWIERYAAGIDEECQLDRIAEAFTTPQPSAYAVRELVKRWRECAKAHEIKADRPDESTEVTEWHAGYGECATFFADELESLLSAASDHQQNAAQGGGD